MLKLLVLRGTALPAEHLLHPVPFLREIDNTEFTGGQVEGISFHVCYACSRGYKANFAYYIINIALNAIA
jgi:hypothetical protein